MATGTSWCWAVRHLVLAARVRAAVAILLVAGCGRPQTMVKGTVTLDGQPLRKAILQFWPEQGDASTAVTLTDNQGRFATALKPVPFRVTIVAQVVAGKQLNPEDPSGPLIDRYKDTVPKLYMTAETTPLRVEPITHACTVADFGLTETAAPK